MLVSATRRASQNHPDVRARIPRPAAVVAEQRGDLEAGLFEAADHLRNRQRAERQGEAVDARRSRPAAR